AAWLRQGRGPRLRQAPVPLQPVRASEMARPDLWRPVSRAPLVTQAGDLFRGIRARPVPDHVRAALLADFAAALDLRVEPRGLAAGAGRDHRRWLVLAVDGAAPGDLGDVRQRRAEGADRQALYRFQGAGAGGAADLSRPVAARLGAPQMALQDDADARSCRPRAGRAAGAHRLA